VAIPTARKFFYEVIAVAAVRAASRDVRALLRSDRERTNRDAGSIVAAGFACGSYSAAAAANVERAGLPYQAITAVDPVTVSPRF
jgi:hypothetical protein